MICLEKQKTKCDWKKRNYFVHPLKLRSLPSKGMPYEYLMTCIFCWQRFLLETKLKGVGVRICIGVCDGTSSQFDIGLGIEVHFLVRKWVSFQGKTVLMCSMVYERHFVA